MNIYIFFHKDLKVKLAPVCANSREQAWDNLVTEHQWCNANRNNCTIVQIFCYQEPIGFDALLPSY